MSYDLILSFLFGIIRDRLILGQVDVAQDQTLTNNRKQNLLPNVFGIPLCFEIQQIVPLCQDLIREKSFYFLRMHHHFSMLNQSHREILNSILPIKPPPEYIMYMQLFSPPDEIKIEFICKASLPFLGRCSGLFLGMLLGNLSCFEFGLSKWPKASMQCKTLMSYIKNGQTSQLVSLHCDCLSHFSDVKFTLNVTWPFKWLNIGYISDLEPHAKAAWVGLSDCYKIIGYRSHVGKELDLGYFCLERSPKDLSGRLCQQNSCCSCELLIIELKAFALV